METAARSPCLADDPHADVVGLLNAALETMPYGFCLWDNDLCLVLCNQRFLDLYGIALSAASRGTDLCEVFQASTQANGRPGYQDQLARIGMDETFVTDDVLASGRVVKVSFRHTPQGDWVATYEDVTEQRDQMRALQQRENQLARQGVRFEAAVNNMSQGLCMFDRHARLVVSNKRYAEIYDLPPALLTPGTSLESILRSRVALGFHPLGDPEAFVQRRLDVAARSAGVTDTIELQDGRVVAILHQPMADGGWVSTHQDITEQRRADARIHHLARHDVLTDLPNRLLFRERMDQVVAWIARGETVAVLIIDLDYYKAINDVFGHGIGDAVLGEVGARLSAICAAGDTVARLGGDEFAILQTGINTPEDAARLAGRIVRLIAEPMMIENHEIIIGASIGVAVAPRDGQTAATLMKNADLALYRAKSRGRSTYQFFEPAMDAALQKRLAFEVDMRSALAAGELSLSFQPFFTLARHRICGFESLLRWHHPTRGLILPADVIPIAEETGLIIPVGEWVLRTACAAAAGWPEDVQVSVNLSPIQFRHRNLGEHVMAALVESGIRPDRLELEITEPALLADSRVTMETLHQLRRIGVKTALDGFGAERASLGFLRSFPFDRIKIDRSFVEDVSKLDGASIVGAVVGLGGSLGMSATATGIETEAHLDLIRDQGFTEAQGYLFNPPLPASAVATLLAGAGGGSDATGSRAAS